MVTFKRVKGRSEPIIFYLEELPGGAPNSVIPLLIRARMANFDVHRVLVDEGSSIDVMYNQLFRTLQLNDSHISLYVGLDLQGFNGLTSKPRGYVKLMVTFSEDTATRQVKVHFLVIDCPSLYNCILRRLTLAELVAVPSTVHLKTKFYTKRAQVATIQGDLAAARIFFNAEAKGHSTVDTRAWPTKKAATVRPEHQQSES